MKKAIVLVVLSLAALVGCASIEKHAHKAVDKYCGAVDETSQAAIRGRVDAMTSPHTVRIHCATDEELFIPEGGEANAAE